MEEGGYNLYSITSNDAVNQVDLLGLATILGSDGSPIGGEPPSLNDCDPFRLPPRFPATGGSVPPPPSQPPRPPLFPPPTVTPTIEPPEGEGEGGFKMKGSYEPGSGKFDVDMETPEFKMGPFTMGFSMKASGEKNSIDQTGAGATLAFPVGPLTVTMGASTNFDTKGNASGAAFEVKASFKIP